MYVTTRFFSEDGNSRFVRSVPLHRTSNDVTFRRTLVLLKRMRKQDAANRETETVVLTVSWRGNRRKKFEGTKLEILDQQDQYDVT
jgi:hypothetical protein